MRSNDNELPENLIEVFTEKECEYKMYSEYSEGGMDNIESMKSFLEYLNVKEENIDLNDGTFVVLKHSDFDYKIALSSSGMGDFYSHRIESSVHEE